MDNGSTDRAAAVGARVAAELEPGYGNAIRSGIAAARGQYITLGDGEHDRNALEPFWEQLQSGYDLVVGSRLVYMSNECRDVDVEPRFFLHIIPIDHNDLPEHREQYAFDNLDFRFGHYEFWYGEQCIAMRGLPCYDVDRIRTGQYTDAGRIWEGEFALSG